MFSLNKANNYVPTPRIIAQKKTQEPKNMISFNLMKKLIFKEMMISLSLFLTINIYSRRKPIQNTPTTVAYSFLFRINRRLYNIYAFIIIICSNNKNHAAFRRALRLRSFIFQFEVLCLSTIFSKIFIIWYNKKLL